jgi:multiple sugar transport system permease protein
MSRSAATPYGFLTPKLMLFLVFILGPLVSVFGLSLYNWNLLGDHRFIGLGNYTELLSDREFWRALQNTVLFGSVVVPVTLLGGFALAVTLNPPQPGKRIFRSILYLPDIISGVAVATVTGWIFNDNYGVLNALLQKTTDLRLPWLSSPHLAMVAVLIATIWTRTGFCMVVYLAALQDVPPDLYEAARLDGAGRWQQLRHITWPMVRQTTIFLLVTTTIYSFHVFELIFVLTGGGPAFSTTVLVQYLYEAGFDLQRQGYAAAIGVILYTLISLVTITIGLLARRKETA